MYKYGTQFYECFGFEPKTKRKLCGHNDVVENYAERGFSQLVSWLAI